MYIIVQSELMHADPTSTSLKNLQALRGPHPHHYPLCHPFQCHPTLPSDGLLSTALGCLIHNLRHYLCNWLVQETLRMPPATPYLDPGYPGRPQPDRERSPRWMPTDVHENGQYLAPSDSA